MFKFEHEPEEVNLIIQALEHKIRSMQAFLQSLIDDVQAQQAPAPIASTETPVDVASPAPIASTETPVDVASPNDQT